MGYWACGRIAKGRRAISLMLLCRDDSSIHYKYNGRHHPATGDVVAGTRLAARGPESAAEAGAVTAPMLVLLGQHDG